MGRRTTTADLTGETKFYMLQAYLLGQYDADNGKLHTDVDELAEEILKRSYGEKDEPGT